MKKLLTIINIQLFAMNYNTTENCKFNIALLGNATITTAKVGL